jgi:hypothetical protein
MAAKNEQKFNLNLIQKHAWSQEESRAAMQENMPFTRKGQGKKLTISKENASIVAWLTFWYGNEYHRQKESVHQ